MGLRSMAEFKADLSKLVAQTNTGRARQNMPVRTVFEGQEYIFDTPQEAAAFAQSMRGMRTTPEPSPAPTAAPRPGRTPPLAAFSGPLPSPQQAAYLTRRTSSPAPRQVREPESRISYGQAERIGKAIGGLKNYCPELAGQKVEGGSHVEALTRLGLTRGSASKVISAMNEAGIPFYPKSKAEEQRAISILESIGGVSCPVPTKRNPAWTRAYNNGRYQAIPSEFPAQDYEYGPRPKLAGGSSYWPYSYDQFYRENPRRNPSARRALPNSETRWVELNEPVYYKMPQNAGPYLPQMMEFYGVGGWPASYEPAKAKENGFSRRNRTEHLLPVPSFPATPREAASSLYAIPETQSFPIGDLYHARMAVVWATTWPNLTSKKDRVLSAVMAAYPQYDWAAFSRDELAQSKLGRRKKGR